jgi:CMP-N-acetylneuraminic acid synthetase
LYNPQQKKNTEHGKIVAIIKVRGLGSTLIGKNMYPLNGRPVLGYAIKSLTKVPFINRIYVWSESEEIRKYSKTMGAVPLHRPLSMIHYTSGFHTDHEFNFHSLNQMKDDLNSPIEIIINFNCNYILFSTKSIEEMFHKLMSDSKARAIIALAAVEPGLCLDNGRHGLFPFLNDSNITNEQYPRFYRKLGISMYKCGLQYAALRREIYFTTTSVEGLDLHDSDDAILLEYHLSDRK